MGPKKQSAVLGYSQKGGRRWLVSGWLVVGWVEYRWIWGRG